jgi:hypothetical protein
MVLEDVEWVILAAGKQVAGCCEKFAGFAECRGYLCWARDCQLVGDF